jgi:WD40 repeat protein
VLTGDYFGNLRLWSFCGANHRPLPRLIMPGVDDRISSIVVSPDGRWLISGDGSDRVFAWDLVADPELANPIAVPHEGGTPNIIRFIDDGTRFLVAASNGLVEDWVIDESTPTLSRNWQQDGAEGRTESLAYDKDSQTLLVGTTGGNVDVWDMAAESEDPTTLAWEGGRVRAVALAKGGRTAIVAGDYPEVAIWPDWTEPEKFQKLDVAVEGTNGLAVSPDDRFLAAAGADGKVYTWTAAADGGFGHRVALFGHEAAVQDVKFINGEQPDELYLLSHDWDGDIHIWDFNWGSVIDRACRAVGSQDLVDLDWSENSAAGVSQPICEETHDKGD